MAHKKKNVNDDKNMVSYKIEDALQIADEILKLGKDKKYNVGAFVHGMIFALEYTQTSFKIPQQQMAGIKRDCRKYFQHVTTVKDQK